MALPWAQIILGVAQLAASAYGAKRSSDRMTQEQARRAGHRNWLKGEMGQNHDLTMRLLAMENQQRSYYQGQQQFRDMMAMNVRDYEKSRIFDIMETLSGERKDVAGRQQTVDLAQKQDYLTQLRRITEGANISASERSFAERELRKYEANLERERKYEKDIHKKVGSTLSDERAWRLTQLAADRETTRKEYEDKKVQRSRYIARVKKFSDAIERTQDSLGDPSARKTYGQSDVQRAYNANMANVMPGWREALTAATSTTDAGIIRAGLGDQGGNANQQRGEVAARMSASLMALQNQAKTAAIGEITSYQGMEDQRIADELRKRNLAMSETAATYGPSIGYEGQTPGIGTSVLYRDPGSAAYGGLPGTSLASTAYQNLPSAYYAGSPNISSLGATLNLPSAAYTGMPSSGIGNWLGMPTSTSAGQIYNPTGYLSAMSGTFMNQNVNPGTGMAAAGTAFSDLIKIFGNMSGGTGGGGGGSYGGSATWRNPNTGVLQ